MRREKLLCCLLLLVLPCALLRAAPPAKQPPAADKSGDNAIDTYLATASAAMEDSLAALMLRRQPEPADQPWLDLQIDCRVIQHWMIAQNQADDHHDRAALILRQQQLAMAQADLDDWILKNPVALSAVQRMELAKVHKLTFTLNDEKASHTPDEVSQAMGNALFALAGLGDLKALPVLRPKPAENNPADAAAAKPQNPPASLADLATAAKQANVPPALHTQLVALAQAATRPSTPVSAPGGKDDSQQEKLQKLLRDSVELLNDLTALSVAVDVRDKSQGDLADALVLSLDPRTAAMGEEKFQSLKQMRSTLSGIAASRLSKEITDDLAPLLSWAATNPTPAAPVLKSLRSYLDTCEQFDHLPAPEPALPPALEKIRQQIAATFTTTRGKFLTDVAGVAGFTDNGPVLTAEADELQRMVLVTQAISRIPADLAAVAAIKFLQPPPPLDKHITAAADAAATTIKSPLRDQAMRTLDDLHKFSVAVAALAATHSDDLPADVMPKAIDNRTALKLDICWHKVVLQGISGLANNGAVDQSIYDRLQSMSDLLQLGHALADAREVDAQAAKLTGWVDWNLPAGQLDNLLKPLQTGLLDALTAVGGNDWPTAIRLTHGLKKYQPLLKVLQATTARADDCPTRPDGLRGDAAALLTPMADQPCAAQRMISMVGLLFVQVQAQQALLVPPPVPQPPTANAEPQAMTDLRNDLLANLPHE